MKDCLFGEPVKIVPVSRYSIYCGWGLPAGELELPVAELFNDPVSKNAER